jgi:hypothetical protein
LALQLKVVGLAPGHPGNHHGCQMVYLQNKNPNLDKFLRALEWKMLVYFIPLWNILLPFGIFYGHLVLL